MADSNLHMEQNSRRTRWRGSARKMSVGGPVVQGYSSDLSSASHYNFRSSAPATALDNGSTSLWRDFKPWNSVDVQSILA